MTWAAFPGGALALIQAPQLDTNSAISIGLMIVIITATGYISRMFTRHEAKLERIDEKLTELRNLPHRMTLVENHVANLEADINNLWTAYRGADPNDVRRERGPRPFLRPDNS